MDNQDSINNVGGGVDDNCSASSCFIIYTIADR